MVKLIGGKLRVKQIKNLLNASYSNLLSDIDDFKIDKSLSNQLIQVYYNENTNQAVVVHRGTANMNDVIVDTKLLFGFKNNSRFNDARNIQKLAEKKYGNNNVSTIGHSLGAAIAEDVGKNSKEIITLNKPITPSDIFFKKKVGFNQYDIRTKKDPISLLKPFQRDVKDITIDSITNNPLIEHSTNTLDRLPQDLLIGGSELRKLKLKELKSYIKSLKKNKQINFNITGKNKKQLREAVEILNNK
jgi:hypothetical protein